MAPTTVQAGGNAFVAYFRFLTTGLLLPLLIIGLSERGRAAGTPVAAPRPANWRGSRPPVEAVIPLPPVSETLAALNSPRYHRREMAGRLLTRYGVAAIPELQAAAASSQPEIAIRSLNALEAITANAMRQSEGKLAEAGLIALDELARGEAPRVSRRVAALLLAHSTMIHDFSLAQVARYHGTVVLRKGIGQTLPDGGERPGVDHIIIGRNWSGGIEGLIHARHLNPLVGVYFIRGVDLPKNIVDIFQSRAPQLQVAIRGPSRLGVSSMTRGIAGAESVPCVISAVAEKSAAAKAGMKHGDVVVKFNKHVIENFEDLVEAIGEIEPGTTVPALVSRLGKPVEMQVTLQPWIPSAEEGE